MAHFYKSNGLVREHIEGRFAVQMVSISLRLDLIKEEDILLFICGEAVEYHLVKLYTSCQVKLCLFLAF